QQLNEDLQTYLDDASVTQPVHIILDMREVGQRPPRLNDMQATLKVASHPRLGWLLSYGGNPTARFAITTLAQLTGTRLRMFDQADALLVFLGDIDETLNWGAANTDILPPIFPA
ncbi:MAG: hypothetical protein ACLFTK_12890, partial [Anaerolineales bacterium]